jgi:hypothetical protein
MNWPTLQADQLANTRDALHSYAQVLGDWLKATRPRRKHWWHASLRPSLRGLTTGVIAGPVPFELELNLADSLLEARTDGGASVREPLAGQAPRDLAVTINLFLTDAGLDTRDAPAISPFSSGPITSTWPCSGCPARRSPVRTRRTRSIRTNR